MVTLTAAATDVSGTLSPIIWQRRLLTKQLHLESNLISLYINCPPLIISNSFMDMIVRDGNLTSLFNLENQDNWVPFNIDWLSPKIKRRVNNLNKMSTSLKGLESYQYKHRLIPSYLNIRLGEMVQSIKVIIYDWSKPFHFYLNSCSSGCFR